MSAIEAKNAGLAQNTVVQSNNDKKFFVKITKGFEQGAVFQMSSNEVLIGRDPSNHIQLKNDSKISRHHVRLLYKNSKYIIQDITKNNFIIVNGIKLKQAELKNNDVLQIGDHILQYVETDPAKNAQKFNPNTPVKNNNTRYILYAIILFGLGYYLTTPPQQKAVKKLENFETESKSERRIDSLDESIEALDKKFKESMYYSENGQNANSIYIQGKRDFDRGQFFYARDAFSAVLSLEPKHAEARRMLRLSNQYADDLLERQFKDGLANKDVGRYDICISAMKNIMNMTNNPSSPRYLEAKKIATECNLLKKGNL